MSNFGQTRVYFKKLGLWYQEPIVQGVRMQEGNMAYILKTEAVLLTAIPQLWDPHPSESGFP